MIGVQNTSPVVRYTTAGTNIVFHGNSLVYGQSGASVPAGAMPYQVQRLAPVNNLVTCQNYGVNGQRWGGMMTSGTGASVDALFDPAKKNVLIAWEGTNDINGGGLTAAQAFANAQAYTAERIASKNWIIVHMTCLPCYYQSFSDSTSASINTVLAQYNLLLRNGWKAIGAKGLADVQQAGSPFLLPNFNRSTFLSATYSGQSIWSPNDQQGGGGTGQNQFVHCSDTGYGVLANIVAAALRRLPAR